MTTPVRLQLSRRKGFDLQAHSRAVNGLPAVNVARPNRWGNPWKIGDNLHDEGCAPEEGQPANWRTCKTAADCVQGFRQSVDWEPPTYEKPWRIPTEEGCLEMWGGYGPEHKNRITIRAELAGKNLACWCDLPKEGEPDICHGAVLLELAGQDRRFVKQP